MSRFLLSLMLPMHVLLHGVAAKLNITYPVASITYPPTGPDEIQWTYASGDPTNITIYLTTYTGNAVSNNLYGLTWPTSDGSVYMHFEDQPPFGDTWTWTFYDTSTHIEPSTNQIAESPHFYIQGSKLNTTTPSPTNGANATTAATHHGLSVGGAVGVTIVVMLVVVALCFLGAFYLYRTRKRAVMTDETVIRDAQPVMQYVGNVRSELDGRHGGLELGSGLTHEMQGDRPYGV